VTHRLLRWKKKKEKIREHERLPAATTEFSAGAGAIHNWGPDVVVTRQVIVQTSGR
jgi:hypothetical protein